MKRAREVEVGDTFPDGSHVVSVSKSETWVNIRTRVNDEPVKLRRYRPKTFIPSDDNPYPSQHESGHPWARYGVRHY